MPFWIFMLITLLLLPVNMIGFGSYFLKKAPKEINNIFGYRTKMSMKNKDTWEFAHHYCGQVWRIVGWGMLVVSSISMFFSFREHNNVIGVYVKIIFALQIILLIITIVLIEKALKDTFDKNGNRRN